MINDTLNVVAITETYQNVIVIVQGIFLVLGAFLSIFKKR